MAAAAIAAALYFAVFATVGLGAYFTLDDGGNLLNAHGYWENSPGGSRGIGAAGRDRRISEGGRAFLPWNL